MRGPLLVLASASPRRTEILRMLGIAHEVLAAGVDESELPGEDPRDHAERLARAKAVSAAGRRPDALVLGGDTVVTLDGEILGKPSGPADAERTLLRLAGRAHTVHTALALHTPDGRLFSRVESATVEFRPFGADTARAYAATGEPLDKAGAYGIQGLGAALIRRIEGDYYAVVGLPVAGLLHLLEAAGWRYAFGGGLVPVEEESP